MNIKKHTVEAIKGQANSLLELAERDKNDYEAVINLILSCRGKLIFTGMGKSGIIAKKLAATYSSTGIPSFFVHPGEAYHGDLGMIEAEDVIFAFSNSGETKELVNMLKFSRSRNIIGASRSGKSTLANLAELHIECRVDREICPLNLAPTTSTTAALVVGDAICATIMQLKSFTDRDFAAFHPGGSLGKALLTKAGDLVNPNVYFVQKDTPLTEVLIKISEGRMGLVGVGDRQNVLGIITDGDVRRALASGIDLEVCQAYEIANRSPIFISESTGLSEMNDLFVKHKIVSLLVGNSQKLLGIVQLYDIQNE